MSDHAGEPQPEQNFCPFLGEPHWLQKPNEWCLDRRCIDRCCVRSLRLGLHRLNHLLVVDLNHGRQRVWLLPVDPAAGRGR